MSQKSQITTGGNKKFLYSGPPKRRGPATQFEEDVDDTEWDFNSHPVNTHQESNQFQKFTLDDAWSIKKNVNIPNTSTDAPSKPGTQDGWNINASKGFYSRHGGMTDETKENGQSNKSGGGGSWNQGTSRNFSYSYAKPSPVDQSGTDWQTAEPSGVGSTNQSNLFKAGGISQGGRHGNYNSGNRGNINKF